MEKLEKNRVDIIFSIDKGKKAKIAKIYFLGDKKIRDKNSSKKFILLLARKVPKAINKTIIKRAKTNFRNLFIMTNVLFGLK